MRSPDNSAAAVPQTAAPTTTQPKVEPTRLRRRVRTHQAERRRAYHGTHQHNEQRPRPRQTADQPRRHPRDDRGDHRAPVTASVARQPASVDVGRLRAHPALTPEPASPARRMSRRRCRTLRSARRRWRTGRCESASRRCARPALDRHRGVPRARPRVAVLRSSGPSAAGVLVAGVAPPAPSPGSPGRPGVAPPGSTAGIPTATCSPSATSRARFSPLVSVPGSTPPAALIASTTRAPSDRRTTPGRATAPTTSTTMTAAPRSLSDGSELGDSAGDGADQVS